MIVSLASDHAGFDQKGRLAAYVKSLGHTVLDRGPETSDAVDYPDFARLVAQDVSQGEADRGILVCGTGIGMAIAADKVAGIRACNITTPQFAEMCRRHNDANVITLSGRFVDPEVNEEIVKTFLTTDFEGGRHAHRIEKVMGFDF